MNAEVKSCSWEFRCPKQAFDDDKTLALLKTLGGGAEVKLLKDPSDEMHGVIRFRYPVSRAELQECMPEAHIEPEDSNSTASSAVESESRGA